ncbi:piggyBac transposable element-derived protein 3-like [Lates calcarifer]|uniref:PiggyBac transposable element-derived protein 3-like n=1 Tax=Lates calcarifer TaxID=8187 RepID=A0AAJ7VGY6_LATCA|nr:piggyBac transposable element-derived protein 3-like [Lates calcarifer]
MTSSAFCSFRLKTLRMQIFLKEDCTGTPQQRSWPCCRTLKLWRTSQLCLESEMHAHDTDCDSDQSDDEATDDHNRLPSRLLKGEGFLLNSEMQLPNPPDDDPGCSSSVSQTETRKVSGTNEKVTSQTVGPMLHKTKNQDRKFKKIKIVAKAPAHANKKYQIPHYIPKEHDPGFTSDDPVDIFLTFYSKSLRDATLEMPHWKYSIKGKTLNLTEDELLTFYNILLISGYNTIPRWRLLWSDDYDVSNTAVKDAMQRNRFDEIMSSVHLVDNMKITADPFFKVCPLFKHLNDINNAIPIAEHLAVDEMMIEYFGRHGCKQFIRGKPIRFGYKMWSLASSSGFVHQMEPYVGSHTHLVKTGLGQGPSVVLGLAEKAQVPPGVKFYHDNLFTTLSLVDEMTLRGYGSCGTMRQTQLHNVPFTAPQTFKKTPRGDSKYLVEAEKLIVRWNDNSVVTVVSNMEREFTETEAKRWNKQKRTMDKVRQPKCIQDYNTHMGGVDLHDQFVSRYRVNIQSKKWWWPCFSWALNSAMVNSWCCYRSWKSGQKDLLSFQRLVAQTLLLRHGTKPSRQGRRSSMAVAITDATRFDSFKHWPCNTVSGVLQEVPH